MRKQAYGTQEDDDAWRLESVIVLLYDDATVPLSGSRLFSLFAPRGMWFGNEHGHQAWFSESRNFRAARVRHPIVRGFLDQLGAKAYPAVKRPVRQKTSKGKKR